MTLTPLIEVEARLSRLQSLLLEQGIDGVLVLHSIDVFYFSGTRQNAQMYIPAQGRPLLMVKKSLDRAKQECQLEHIIKLTSVKNIPILLQSAGLPLPQTMGLELDVLPTNLYFQLSGIFKQVVIKDASDLIKKVRMVKSPFEVEMLRDTGAMMTKVHQHIPEILRDGMSELELASKVEAIARAAGHEGYLRMRAFNQELYYGHIISGANAAVASFFDGPTGGLGLSPAYPHSVSTRQIERNTPIVVDYVGIKNGYMIDLTRMYSIGPIPEKLMTAFQASLEVQQAVVSQLKPGVDCNELYQAAVDKAAALGYASNLMGFAPDQAKFVAHGVGLELDEGPVLAKGARTTLQAGNVIALEPKFTFPGEGVVGIENTFLVTEEGAQRIYSLSDEFVTV